MIKMIEIVLPFIFKLDSDNDGETQKEVTFKMQQVISDFQFFPQ